MNESDSADRDMSTDLPSAVSGGQLPGIMSAIEDLWSCAMKSYHLSRGYIVNMSGQQLAI